MKFHAGLAQAANALSEFRLLNNCAPCLVGCGDNGEGYRKLMNALNGGPSGTTPLCRHINDIVHQIQGMLLFLRRHLHRHRMSISRFVFCIVYVLFFIRVFT